MGGCCSNTTRSSTSSSSTSPSQPNHHDKKKGNSNVVKTKKQLMNDKKTQNNMINQWLGQYKGISFQIDLFKEQLLSRMEHQKKYRNWTLDKLFSECYYRNVIQHEEMFKLSRNIKDLSKKLEVLINKSSEKDRYSNANCELVEELKFCIEGFTPFVTIADRIPLIPENQVTQVKTIQDLVPVLTTSQSMH